MASAFTEQMHKKEQNLIIILTVEENLQIVEIDFIFQSLQKYVVD